MGKSSRTVGHHRAKQPPHLTHEFLQATLDVLAPSIAILDQIGHIVAVNASWRHYADENGLGRPDYGIGRNYLLIEETATPSAESYEDALDASAGIREVLAGQCDEFQMESPCHSPREERWYLMRVTRFHSGGQVYGVVTHETTTRRRQAEDSLLVAKESAERAQEKERQRRQEAEHRRRIAEGLRQVLALLNSDCPLEEILRHIAEQAGGLSRRDSGGTGLAVTCILGQVLI